MVKAPNGSNMLRHLESDPHLAFEKSDAGKALVYCRYAAFKFNEGQNLVDQDHPHAISVGLRALREAAASNSL